LKGIIAMNVTLVLLIFFFLAAMLGAGFFYYLTLQNLAHIRHEVDRLQIQARAERASGMLRAERSRCQQELQALETDLGATERDALTPQELTLVDNHRKSIKECVDALKNAGDWLGLPFDLEWVDVLQRLPRLQALYRATLDNPPASTVEDAQWISNASAPVLLADGAAASKHH
jgi:glutathione S-transferase